jgi:hypothetical protein
MVREEDICVVIPIYKQSLSDFEIKSVNQCINVLSNYTICFICPVHLDLTFYEEKFPQIKNYKFFKAYFFDTIFTYNKLMLSSNFYESFDNYSYIQIYQTDAWIFRDELQYWCNLNYDYIGAPWFKKNDENSRKFDGVGNGGFSLRKVSSFIKISNSHKRIKPLKEVRQRLNERKYNIKGLLFAYPIYYLKCIFMLRNNTYSSFNDTDLYEDVFWGIQCEKLFEWFNVPSCEIALKYSFETNPEYLFVLNDNKLPMGCHAWEKYNFQFWEKSILKNEEHI